MKKYFVLYMAKPADFKKVIASMGKMSKAQMAKFNKGWGAWSKRVGMINPGAPVGKNMRVTRKGARVSRNEIGGYSIIQAASHAEAAKKLRNSPHFKMIKRGWIDVMEVLPM